MNCLPAPARCMRCRVTAVHRATMGERAGRGMQRTAARRALDDQIRALLTCAGPVCLFRGCHAALRQE
eukprot:822300-Alexandrium_andersonii.AAC.1